MKYYNYLLFPFPWSLDYGSVCPKKRRGILTLRVLLMIWSKGNGRSHPQLFGWTQATSLAIRLIHLTKCKVPVCLNQDHCGTCWRDPGEKALLYWCICAKHGNLKGYLKEKERRTELKERMGIVKLSKTIYTKAHCSSFWGNCIGFI